MNGATAVADMCLPSQTRTSTPVDYCYACQAGRQARSVWHGSDMFGRLARTSPLEDAGRHHGTDAQTGEVLYELLVSLTG